MRAFLAPPTQGVVLETYGAGNAPQRSDLIGALKDACDRGVVIVSISQCAKGSVSDAYETGRSLLSAGVVSGGDMTPEVSPHSIPCPLLPGQTSGTDDVGHSAHSRSSATSCRSQNFPSPRSAR